MKPSENHWSIADNQGIIHVPDHLDNLVNKVGMQIKFMQYSGKSYEQTVCDIVAIAEDYFAKQTIEALNKEQE